MNLISEARSHVEIRFWYQSHSHSLSLYLTHIPGTLLVTHDGDPRPLECPGPVSTLLHAAPARQDCSPPAPVTEILLKARWTKETGRKLTCAADQSPDLVWQENESKYVANLVQINWQFSVLNYLRQHTALGRHAGQTFLSSQRSISGFFSFKIAMSFSKIETFKELKRNFLRSQAWPLHFPNLVTRLKKGFNQVCCIGGNQYNNTIFTWTWSIWDEE